MRYAVVKADRSSLVRFVEPALDEALLPIVETADEIGENEVLGPVVETIESDRVVAHRSALRALRGMVAVLNPDLTVAQVKDLGPDLVVAGAHVLPLVDASPALEEGQRYGEAGYEVLAERVIRRFAVEEIPPAPLPDLQPYEFRAMLKISGKEAALIAFMDALPEPAQSIAKAKLEYTLSFRRDNVLVEQARQAIGLSVEELDELWLQAAAIT